MTTLNQSDALARHANYKKLVWLASVWSWPVCLVGVALTFILIGGFVPPPKPSWSAQEIAAFFTAEPMHIRFGAMGFLYFSGLTIMFYSVISEEIKKIEGQPSLLARIQLGSAVILVTVFQILGLAWLLCSYRTDVSPDIIRLLNDYCWFIWSMFIPTYIIQYVCVAIAGFMDTRENPTWPRWAAWLNLWIAFGGAGGVAAVFFKDGPFAWNGLIGFWIPVIVYAVGNCVNTWLMHRRYMREQGGLASARGSTLSAV